MRFAKPAAAETSTNIAPLLDVVLLLLIFFMVTTSFAKRQIPLELPPASSAAAPESDPVVVSIDAEGVVRIDESEISEADLVDRLGQLARERGDLEIRADQATRHGAVVRVLDIAKQVELDRVGIAVEPAD